MPTARDELARIVLAQPADSSGEEIVRELVFHVMVEKGLADSDEHRVKSNRELGDWLSAMQLQPTGRKVDLGADVEGYSEE
jgi:hypothetical protein